MKSKTIQIMNDMNSFQMMLCAATVNWCAPWCMPSQEQIKELCKYTKSELATLNGVKGRRLRGPNGGTIFLPLSNGWSITGGSCGLYWSATKIEDMYAKWDNRCAGCLCVYPKKHVEYGGGTETERYKGHLVRPVRKK